MMNTLPFRAACALLAALPALPNASAQDAGKAGIKELPAVKIHRKTNPGDLPYRTFLDLQSYMQSLLPGRDRMIDLRLRVNFASDKSAAYDQFDPKTWAVAIVGAGTDRVVPTSRGGYFLLPELRDAAHENATIMFNTPTREGRIAIEWKVKVGERQTLSWAGFDMALDQVRAVQGKIPFEYTSMREIRMVDYDGLRACFRSADGRIEVGGRPLATRVEGNCQVLKYDLAARAGKGEIVFVGPLDIVTLDRTSSF